jgi:hypothetical protein
VSSRPEISKEKSKTLTLKRSVAIKAIVTDRFKEYIQFEVNTGIQASRVRLDQIDDQLKDQSIPPVVREKLILERDQIGQSMRELGQRLEEIDTLEMGSQFLQGVVDGFVTVVPGDNLYEKLGGMEVIVKDGIVIDIVTATIPTQ